MCLFGLIPQYYLTLTSHTNNIQGNIKITLQIKIIVILFYYFKILFTFAKHLCKIKYN